MYRQRKRHENESTLFIILLFCAAVMQANAQQTYFTDVNSKLIKTLQVKVAGEFISEPYIELNGDQQIQINFDALEQGGVRYSYSIIIVMPTGRSHSSLPFNI